MNAPLSLLVVDDEATYRKALQREFERRGRSVAIAASIDEGMALIAKSPPDVIILDLELAGAGGIGLIAELRQRGCDSEVVVLTASPNGETAALALRSGAFACRSKPIDVDALEAVVLRAGERRLLRAENSALRRALAPATAPALVAQSVAMQRVLQHLPRIAAANDTVLVQGEPGTGRGRIARELHRLGASANEPFVAIDCAALQPALRGSELFGCEKGALPGAESFRPGLFEAGSGGTVFLDNIGALDLESQALLLRLLESRELRRIGSSKSRPLELRLVAASDRDLGLFVSAGRFREELGLRLQTVRIELPPLRERREDILPLFSTFLAASAIAPAPTLSEPARAVLLEYAWPGNVRELKSLAELLAATSAGAPIEVTDLPPRFFATRIAASATSGVPALADVERRHILSVYEHAGRNKRRAAELLGISLRTLYNKLTEYHVHAVSTEAAAVARDREDKR